LDRNAVRIRSEQVSGFHRNSHLSEPTVTRAFYGGLTAAVVLGAVDLPVGVLIGLGVAIARHRRA
jgi:hypothetical protein